VKKMQISRIFLAAALALVMVITGGVSLFASPRARGDGGIVPAVLRDSFFVFNSRPGLDVRSDEALILFTLTADSIIRTSAALTGTVSVTESRGLVAGGSTQRSIDLRTNPSGGRAGTAQVTSVNQTRRERVRDNAGRNVNLLVYEIEYTLNNAQFKITIGQFPSGNLALIDAASNDQLFFPMIRLLRELADDPEQRLISIRAGKNMKSPLEGVWFPTQQLANQHGLPGIRDTVDMASHHLSFYIENNTMFNQHRQSRGAVVIDYSARTMQVGAPLRGDPFVANWVLRGTSLTITNSTIATLPNGTYFRATEAAEAANQEANEGSRTLNLNRLFRN
jgi:hypothetical protein